MNPLSATHMQSVRDHMQLDASANVDGVIATFAHPRYEV